MEGVPLSTLLSTLSTLFRLGFDHLRPASTWLFRGRGATFDPAFDPFDPISIRFRPLSTCFDPAVSWKGCNFRPCFRPFRPHFYWVSTTFDLLRPGCFVEGVPLSTLLSTLSTPFLLGFDHLRPASTWKGCHFRTYFRPFRPHFYWVSTTFDLLRPAFDPVSTHAGCPNPMGFRPGVTRIPRLGLYNIIRVEEGVEADMREAPAQKYTR